MPTTPVVVTVTGFSEATYPPERCTVSLVLQADGPSAERAHAPVASLAQDVAGRVKELVDAGTVDEWSLDQIRQSMHRPYNDSGKQRPYVYRSSAAVDVTFGDLTAADGFVHAVSTLDGVSVQYLDWTLTDASRDEHVLKVRDAAVRDAVVKAQSYAKSLGLNTVRPIAIADPGLLGVSASAASYEPVPGNARMFAAGSQGSDVVELKPDKITLSAGVHARFEAS
jgi:uncharacterized protein YggE